MKSNGTTNLKITSLFYFDKYRESQKRWNWALIFICLRYISNVNGRSGQNKVGNKIMLMKQSRILKMLNIYMISLAKIDKYDFFFPFAVTRSLQKNYICIFQIK